MKRKIVWLLVSFLVVTALALSACQPAAQEAAEGETIKGKVTEKEAAVEEEKEEVVEEEAAAPEKEMVRDTLGRLMEKPRYGGTITFVGWDPSSWDPVTYPESAWTLDLTHDTLLVGDWLKGPVGTGEVAYAQWGPPPLMENAVPAIAESWEMLDPDTYLFTIRKGIHWQDKPPLNGRELTVEDVLKFFERVTTEYGYILTSYNYFESVTQVGPNTIQIKMEPGSGAFVWPIFAEWVEIVPWEVIEQYGDYQDWQNHVGTGPFIVTDYVSGSSITFERNPNYWNTDPLFPENQLPYVDSVKALIIPDRSTYIAAFRAGKLDIAHFRWLEEVEPLRGVPGIVEVPFFDNSPWSVSLKTDDPALPTYDLRVRQALAIAVNRQELIDTLFKGEATLMPFAGPYPELMDIYTPFEELTEAAKYSYKYDPEEAKQLLAEAGYPNGFKITVLSDSVNQEMVAVIAGYWQKIGVETTIDQREGSVIWSMQKAKSWEDAFANGRPDGLHISRMSDTIPGGIWNCSNLDDPEVNALMEKVRSVFHDTKLQHAALKEYAVKALEKVPWVMLPLEYRYNLHWDWVKNYNGAFNLDYQKYGRFTEFSWVDQDRKFELIGQR